MSEDSKPPVRSPRIKAGITLPPTTLRRVEEYLAKSVPEKHKIATERALKAQVPISIAVKTKCLSCCNYEREAVSTCAVVICPLNQYRPYRVKTKV